MATRLRIGLLGCGRAAERLHLPALVRLPEAELTAIAEVDAEQRERSRRLAPGTRLFEHPSALLEEAEVDAVVICLPPALHAEAALGAFARGLHVYVEKPLATSLADGQAVVETWRSSGKVGRIGFNFRFHPLVAALRTALADGAVGELVGVRSVFSAARRSLPVWKQRRASGGGVLLDLAGHHFDLFRFLFEREIVDVAALAHSASSEEDTAAVIIGLAGGPPATVLASLAAVEDDRIEVYGSRGMLVLDRYRSSRLRFVPAARDFRALARVRATAGTLLDVPRVLRNVLLPPSEPSYALALDTFVAAARGRAAPGPDLDDGLRSLAVIIAAEESARTGRVVRVGDAVLDASPVGEAKA